MAIELAPLPLPASADASKFADFGREIKGVNLGSLTQEQLKEIQELLYKVRPPHSSIIGIINLCAHSFIAWRLAFPQRRRHS